MTRNISGFGIGDRVRMGTPNKQLALEIDGTMGTVIGIASESYFSFLGRQWFGQAVVKLDNGVRCGEFISHTEQEGCVLAKKDDNAMLVSRYINFGIEDLI